MKQFILICLASLLAMPAAAQSCVANGNCAIDESESSGTNYGSGGGSGGSATGGYRPPPLNTTTTSSSISGAINEIEQLENSVASQTASAEPSPGDIAADAQSYSCQEAIDLARAVQARSQGAACPSYATAVQIAACRNELIQGGASEAQVNASYSGAVNAYVSLANARLNMSYCLR